MSEASASLAVRAYRLGFLDKAAIWGAWALVGAVFLSVGWLVMAPDDPQGAVTLLGQSDAPWIMLQVAALAGVTAGIATIMAGRSRPDVGPFAVAIGLAAVTLRGDSAEALLIRGAYDPSMSDYRLGSQLALESLGWFAIVVVAIAASSLVIRWFWGPSTPGLGATSGAGSSGGGVPAGFDLPGIGGPAFGDRTGLTSGLTHTFAAAVMAIALTGLLASGSMSRLIRHGQACFVVYAAVFIACYFASRLFPVRSALWSIASVLVLAAAGYGWATMYASGGSTPASIPHSHFLRVLPIQYISVGSAAAIAAFWYVQARADHAREVAVESKYAL